jgi:hypothetical protein
MTYNPPAPEPQGYLAKPGFVKNNPDNNDYYIEQWAGDDWYPIIEQTHERLTKLIPGYNILQIKDKFGGLRYYYGAPEEVPVGEYPWNDTREKVLKQAEDVIRYAEAWVDGYEARKRVGSAN